jgi:hypothetical protein
MDRPIETKKPGERGRAGGVDVRSIACYQNQLRACIRSAREERIETAEAGDWDEVTMVTRGGEFSTSSSSMAVAQLRMRLRRPGSALMGFTTDAGARERLEDEFEEDGLASTAVWQTQMDMS